MSEAIKCATFSYYDYDEWTPCRCPKCKGYLPRYFPIGEQFLCRKCGTVLETMPSLGVDQDLDPEYTPDTEYKHGGRICIVPEVAIKISTEPSPKPKRYRKQATNLWAVGLGFSRRVWKGKDGEFITIDGERIYLDDKRILSIYRDPPKKEEKQ